MSGFNSGKAKHNTFNRSVYSPINKCNFIPNCAYEVLHSFHHMPDGTCIDIYQSDNKQYWRAVVSKKGMRAICGYAGLLIDKHGQVIWKEVNPADRGKGTTKQLKAFFTLTTGLKLWSAYQTPAGLASL